MVSGCIEPRPIDLSGDSKDSSDQQCYDLYMSAREGGSIGLSSRNELISAILRRSEAICSVSKGAIFSASAMAGFATDSLSLLASTLSTAFTPAGTKTALSSSAAIVSGVGTAADANFFQNVLSTAIIREIDSARSFDRANILKKLEVPTAKYPIELALFELEQYHSKCSFYYGISVLAKGTVVEARTKEQIQSEINVLMSESASLQTLISQAKSAGNPALEDQLNSQLSNNMMRIENLRVQRSLAPGNLSSTN